MDKYTALDNLAIQPKFDKTSSARKDARKYTIKYDVRI